MFLFCWKHFQAYFCCLTCLKINSGFTCSFSGAARVSCIWSLASPKMAAISWARTALRLTPSLKWSTITPHINSPSKELNICPCSSLCWFRLSKFFRALQCYGRNRRQRYMPLGMKSSWINIQQIQQRCTPTFGSLMSLIVQKHLVEDTNLYNRYFRSIYS